MLGKDLPLFSSLFPAEAKFFTYHEDDANVKKQWQGSCRCKKDQGDRRAKIGVFSGNLNCGTPAEEPAGEFFRKVAFWIGQTAFNWSI